MCGICGFLTENNIEINNLKNMNNTMFHRGPNDSGEYLTNISGKYLGFAHRRLSIIDLSKAGHQPMFSNDDNIIIIFNGEIYNFLDLKKELPEYKFKSNCDTEVILAGYQKWGYDIFNKLNGMFAIAIYDFNKEELILARDRIGKKPLYYYMNKNEFVFASELKAILEYPYFSKKINNDILSTYFYHGYIKSPDSIFENVYKIIPGTFLVYKKGNISTQKYWNLIERYISLRENPIKDYKLAKEELLFLLKDSVNKRMISDVPLGTFLSGGIDSSLVTAIAQENSSEKIKTFSIGFNEEKYNEAQYAKKISEYLGTDHTEIYINEKEMLKLVDTISDYYDEPMADSSQIPTMLVSKLAKSQVTVSLSGDGGDELFCGYNSYRGVLTAKRLDSIGGIIHNTFSPNIIKKLPHSVQSVVNNRDNQTKSQYGGEKTIDLINSILIGPSINIKYPMEHLFLTNNWQQRRMLVDLLTYLPDDILCKVDRASMKYSLEARCPILDYRIIELSFRLPHRFKYYKDDRKIILKNILYDYIPKNLLDRPKAGFSVPIEKWLKGDLKHLLLEYSEKKFILNQGIFNYENLNNLINNYLNFNSTSKYKIDTLIYYFIIFQQWYIKYFINEI